ncbi:MAG: hypothetical protein NTV43_07810 [Methylococcales bacterium]|nr:hypothetical protein [Methylococcales bacterium]
MTKFIEVTDDTTSGKTAINPDQIVKIMPVNSNTRTAANTKITLTIGDDLFVTETIEAILNSIA